MTDKPSRYERASALFEDSFGTDMAVVGIFNEAQFEIIIPEEEYTPAESIMHFHEAFDLKFL